MHVVGGRCVCARTRTRTHTGVRRHVCACACMSGVVWWVVRLGRGRLPRRHWRCGVCAPMMPSQGDRCGRGRRRRCRPRRWYRRLQRCWRGTGGCSGCCWLWSCAALMAVRLLARKADARGVTLPPPPLSLMRSVLVLGVRCGRRRRRWLAADIGPPDGAGLSQRPGGGTSSSMPAGTVDRADTARADVSTGVQDQEQADPGESKYGFRERSGNTDAGGPGAVVDRAETVRADIVAGEPPPLPREAAAPTVQGDATCKGGNAATFRRRSRGGGTDGAG